VGSGDQDQTIFVVEDLRDVAAEGVSSSSAISQFLASNPNPNNMAILNPYNTIRAYEGRLPWRNAPPLAVVGVGPEQVAHGSFVRYLLHTVQLADVVEGVNGRRETSVQTEDLILDAGSQRKIVEQVCVHLPDVAAAVFADAFVKETIPKKRVKMIPRS
jgi:hypothetical protein